MMNLKSFAAAIVLGLITSGGTGAGPGSGHRKAQREGRGSMGIRNTLNLGREVGRREQSQCRGR